MGERRTCRTCEKIFNSRQELYHHKIKCIPPEKKNYVDLIAVNGKYKYQGKIPYGNKTDIKSKIERDLGY